MAGRRLRRAGRGLPGAVALVDGDRLVTYAELDRAGGDVAAALARHGVAPGGLVRLRLDRGWRVVAGILGCWRHGCGFVPIDPRYPRARQDYIVADTGLRHVLTEDADPDRLAVVAPAAPGGAIPRVPADTAYVIHTSGSTGDPKGVVVRHANVLSLLDACAKVYSLGPDDVWSWFHSHSFDFSVWEIWGALLSGGRVVTVPPATTTDPAALADLLAARRVSVLSQVPSVFGYLVRALQERPVPLPRLRYVVFGGEAIAVPAILRWAALGVAPQAELYNMYGITEITVHATAKLLDVAELRRPARGTPIGVALPNLRLALLADGRPVAPGTPGEIHVAGEGVAWGYLGRPELTAERFPRLDVDGRAEVWYYA